MLYGYMYVYISRQPVTFQNERHFFSKNLSGSFVLNAGDFVVGVFVFFFFPDNLAHIFSSCKSSYILARSTSEASQEIWMAHFPFCRR